MRRHNLVPETAPRFGVLLVWPHHFSDWKDSLESVVAVYLEIARQESLLVVCRDEPQRCHIVDLLKRYRD